MSTKKYILSRQQEQYRDDSSASTTSGEGSSMQASQSPSVVASGGGGSGGGMGRGGTSNVSVGDGGSSLGSSLGVRMAAAARVSSPTVTDNASVASSNLTDDEYGGDGYTAIESMVRNSGPPLPAVPEIAFSSTVDFYVPGQSNPKEVDDLLRLEQLQLSEEEQQDRDDEVHGYLNRAVPETPEMLMGSLQEMQRAILALPAGDRTTYNRIVTSNTNNQYAYTLQNKDFWLKFLRADLFDVNKAALRYCRHLDILHKYWGDDALMRPLYFSDLNKNDLRLFKTGRFQLLFGARDRSGRRIVNIVEPLGKGFDVSCRIKVMLYVFSVASDDISTQRQGFVALLLNWEQDTTDIFMSNSDLQVATKEMVNALPLRASGIHLCLEDTPMAHVVKSVQLLSSGKEIRKNSRVHVGSQLEAMYALQNLYGIPTRDVPLTSTGTIKVLQLKLWIKARQAMDNERKVRAKRGEFFADSSSFFRGVECPDFHCVLFRKAGMAWDHPPNKVFRSILESKQSEKENATKLNEKIQVITDILEEAQNLGFRFLAWNDNKKAGGGPWYVEITDMFYLRECVAQAVRDSIKREKTRKNVQYQDSKGKEGIFQGQYGKKQKISHNNESGGNGCGGFFCSM